MRKRIGILGAARSGIAVAEKALKHGYDVFLSDSNDIDLSNKDLFSKIEYESGGHTDKLLKMDILVVSPGIPNNIPILKLAEERNILIMSEIEFAYRHTHPETKIIAVTGSNGKSTTVSMIHHLLISEGYNAILAGNIGEAYSSFDIEEKKDFIVLECSSFQLENIHDFHPDVAIILNITPDHMDRYSSFEDYVKAKHNIFKNMNKDNDLIINLYTDTSYSKNQNITAAKLAVSAYISEDNINKHIATFKPLRHRFESVVIKNNIEYINDSKATNTASVIFALNNINKPTHLILGGSDKGEDYSVLISNMRNRVKELYLIGSTAHKMYEIFNNDFICNIYSSLEEVVKCTKTKAIPGDVVLLSPACASFDWFKNFEHRGETFCELVKKLI